MIHYKAILPTSFVFFFKSQSGEMSPEPVAGFQKFKRRFGAEKILYKLKDF